MSVDHFSLRIEPQNWCSLNWVLAKKIWSELIFNHHPFYTLFKHFDRKVDLFMRHALCVIATLYLNGQVTVRRLSGDCQVTVKKFDRSLYSISPNPRRTSHCLLYKFIIHFLVFKIHSDHSMRQGCCKFTCSICCDHVTPLYGHMTTACHEGSIVSLPVYSECHTLE